MPRAGSSAPQTLHGAGMPAGAAPPAVPTGCFADAIAALRADAERHRAELVTIDRLIAELEKYAANGAAPRAPLPKHAGGRPVLDPSDERRARKAASMRLRREKLKAAAASEVAAPAKKEPSDAAAVAEPEPSPAAVEPEPPTMSADDLLARCAAATKIEDIIEVVNDAVTLTNAAADAKDVATFRIARETKLKAERKGGMMLREAADAGRRLSAEKLGIGNVSWRWRELAAMSDTEFEQAVASILKNGFRRVHPPRNKDRPHTSLPPPPEISISAWATDETGCLSRTLVTAGETPVLAGEERPST